jgi:hypothetical protein
MTSPSCMTSPSLPWRSCRVGLSDSAFATVPSRQRPCESSACRALIQRQDRTENDSLTVRNCQIHDGSLAPRLDFGLMRALGFDDANAAGVHHIRTQHVFPPCSDRIAAVRNRMMEQKCHSMLRRHLKPVADRWATSVISERRGAALEIVIQVHHDAQRIPPGSGKKSKRCDTLGDRTLRKGPLQAARNIEDQYSFRFSPRGAESPPHRLD